MNPARRSLCIVSRDPLQCSELVLSLQAALDPDDEIEIVMDRRRERSVFEANDTKRERGLGDRRRNTHVDLEVRTKGFAIVPAASGSGAFRAPRSLAAPDADDRARFENILSFKRKRDTRPRLVVGAASAVVVALVLSPMSGVSDRVTSEVPPSSGAAQTPSASGSPAAPGFGHAPPLDDASRPRAHAPASGSSAGRSTKPKRGALETYTGRVEDTTGRIVSKAKKLIDRVKIEVAGNAPMSADPDLPSDDEPGAARPRPTQTP